MSNQRISSINEKVFRKSIDSDSNSKFYLINLFLDLNLNQFSVDNQKKDLGNKIVQQPESHNSDFNLLNYKSQEETSSNTEKKISDINNFDINNFDINNFNLYNRSNPNPKISPVVSPRSLNIKHNVEDINLNFKPEFDINKIQKQSPVVKKNLGNAEKDVKKIEEIVQKKIVPFDTSKFHKKLDFDLPVKYKTPNHYKLNIIIMKLMSNAKKEMESNTPEKSLESLELAYYYLNKIEKN